MEGILKLKKTIPTPGRVVDMARAYDAPWLEVAYCRFVCQIGQKRRVHAARQYRRKGGFGPEVA